VRACPHDGVDRCRKPAPGMLLDLALEFDVDLTRSYMIGDRWVDIAAAERAGVRPVLLETTYSWQPSGGADPPTNLAPEFRGATLESCVSFVLSHT